MRQFAAKFRAATLRTIASQSALRRNNGRKKLKYDDW
jgi:hypothetical protein